MIDHISIPVRDLKASARFYEALLAPLGMTRVVERSNTIGFGKTYPEFWLNVRAKLEPQPEDSGAHIALRAPSTEAVDAFHAAALAAGAHSDGTPGMRLEYSNSLLRRLRPRLGWQPGRGRDVFERDEVRPLTTVQQGLPSPCPFRPPPGRPRASSAECPPRDWRPESRRAMPKAQTAAYAYAGSARAEDPNSL